MEETKLFSKNFLDLEKIYLARLAQLPALYTLIYQQYRKEAAAHEEALLLALAILLAQGTSQLHSEEQFLNNDFSGRLCFRFSELLEILQITIVAVVSQMNSPRDAQELTSYLHNGLCFHNLRKMDNAYLKQLPKFCAVKEENQTPYFEAYGGAYFCYWQSEQHGELGFCLVRMAQLQQNLFHCIRNKSKPAKLFQENLFGQPQFLLDTLAHMKNETLANGKQHRLPQKQRVLQNCLEKLCQSHLLLISGGPGSGKTTLLASLLQIFKQAEQSNTQRKLELALCAPTARAAQRMLQNLANILGAESERFKASTLHKLLGLGWSAAKLHRPAIQTHLHYRNPKNIALLRLDLLVIDEVSMLDCEIAWNLFSHLHPQTRVILIGDPEQLPPVGCGAFWTELLAAIVRKNSILADCLVELKTSHRSVAEIQQLSQNVLRGQKLQEQNFAQLLPTENKKHNSIISWQPLSLPTVSGNWEQHAELLGYLWKNWCPYIALHHANTGSAVNMTGDMIEPYFQWLHNYSILSPLLRGAGGAQTISQMLLQYGARQFGKAENFGFFHGCPIQITRNNYQLGLHNGDRGFCLQLGFESQLYGVFESPNSQNAQNTKRGEDGLLSRYRLLPIGQLEHCEVSFVQTIHKSQGSEYSNVCILMPESGNFWSKPLLYTAITRAKQRVCFIGSQDALVKTSIYKQATPFSLFTEFSKNGEKIPEDHE